VAVTHLYPLAAAKVPSQVRKYFKVITGDEKSLGAPGHVRRLQTIHLILPTYTAN
jgi:hypothetical protein